MLHNMNRRKGNWIGHMLSTNCLLKHAVEGKVKWRIKFTGRRGRRYKQLLDGLKEMRGHWKLQGRNISVSQLPGRGPVPGPGINYTGPREILLELITNLNVILYLSPCHTVYITVLILFMIMT